MLRLIVPRGFPPFATGDAIVEPPPEEQWLWDVTVRPIRVYDIRARDDRWIEWGHIEDTNPYLDTSD